MFTAIFLLAVAGSAAAAPGLLLTQRDPVAILSSESTVTKSGHVINHGSTPVHVPLLPVVHAAAVHAPVAVVHSPVVSVVHAPVVHGPVVHALTPSAVSHSSSTSHHTEFQPVQFVTFHR